MSEAAASQRSVSPLHHEPCGRLVSTCRWRCIQCTLFCKSPVSVGAQNHVRRVFLKCMVLKYPTLHEFAVKVGQSLVIHIARWCASVRSVVMQLQLLLMLLLCDRAKASKPPSKPALRPSSMQKRVQTLLHCPSDAALADVLNGQYHPDSRPGFQRTALGVTVIALMTLAISTAAGLAFHLLNKVHTKFVQQVHRETFLMFCGNSMISLPYVLCLFLPLRFVISSSEAILASYEAIFKYTVPEGNVLNSMFKRMVHVMYGTLILCFGYVFFSRALLALSPHRWTSA